MAKRVRGSPRSKKVLLVAFHYPPFGASSGIQRTLSFSVHLQRYGWTPHVLTVRSVAYDSISDDQVGEIPKTTRVRRTLALDAARHLAVRGRYWSRLAIPDRWANWWLTAVPAGLRIICREGIEAVWSTYPIATAHRIGATLARRTGLPWVADFRDPMVEYFPKTRMAFPADPAVREARLAIEARAARLAARLVFCTESARDIVTRRYAFLEPGRTAVISNGFDETSFRQAETLSASATQSSKRVLLHSGTIYLGPDRDPTALFVAIRRLAERKIITAESFELRLRGPTGERELRSRVAEHGIEHLVSIEPPLPYRQALAEIMSADMLLLLQGETSNPAVPAKLYEYLRARRPIIACAHPDGEVARLLGALGFRTVAPMTDADRIASVIESCLNRTAETVSRLPPMHVIAAYSREVLTGSLARILDDVCSESAD